ncbi:MAG TPA: endo-1,3-alpha-glucanase family glycosylhydrolase [Terriglobales bacterium]|nr:endo-1,3-alpha-glucanase family glycosylhydrolase [Terriglobales bacterium]
MRKGLILAMFMALVVSGWAANLKIVPTTTLAAETSNNTSAANSFKSQSNGNLGAGNVSKVDLHSLLYSGNNTKMIAHFMPWFGDPRHMDVGYNSHDVAQIHAQITDMISRGVDGVIIDWYGDKDYTDLTAKLVMAEAEAHPGFTFAIMVDKGAISLSPCPGCTPQQTLISQVQYVEQTYVPSPAYMRINGRPVITNFDIDLHYTIDWNAVAAATSTNPDFIFQHSSGFTHAMSGGSYSWVIVNVTDFGMAYLDKFYKGGLAAPKEYALGAGYKGFNDSLASWGTNRIMGQQCGQTWLQTFSKANSYYNSGNQLDALQLVTWNDYEEGTEIETGIDNCFSLSSSLKGATLQWTITGNENTIDHYEVYISSDGQSLMPLNSMTTGSRSLDLSSYSLANGTYTLFVQAVGKPTFINHMSGSVKYTVQANTGGGSDGGTGGGSGTAPQISLGAAPASLTIAVGKSGSTKLTVTSVSGAVQSAVVLTCSNLPVGAACSFAPASLMPGSKSATSTLTLSLSAVFAGLHDEVPGVRHQVGPGLLWSGFGIAGIAITGAGFRRRRLLQGLSLLTVLGAVGLFTACGGGPSASKSLVAANPTGNVFSFTVNGDSGNTHSSVTLTVTVN